MDSDRRSFILGGSAMLFAAGCNQQPPQADATRENPYDWAKPLDNLDAFVKVIGDTAGHPAWLSAQGRIYAMRPNEMPVPILAIEGLRHVQFKAIESGYRWSLRDWAFYRDINTGEVLDQFSNPFTGAINETRHILTGYYSWTLGPNGQDVPGFGGKAWWIDRPFILPWTQDRDYVTVPMELLVQYESGASGGEWMHLTAKTGDLFNPDLTSAPMTHAWTGDSAWVRWMEMGDTPGRTLWQSTGQKHRSIETLRPELRSAIDRYFPGSIEDPAGYERTSYTVSPAN
ncbi:MAG: DUF1838 family protein [Woeseiaceae bacterium]|nr:DUF1838 family protein [Woeseiaceae bacterium]